MNQVLDIPITFITDVAVAYEMAVAQAPYQEAAIEARELGQSFEERKARNMAEAVGIVAGRAALAQLNQEMFSKAISHMHKQYLTFEERMDADLAEVARVNAGLTIISRLEKQVESGEPSRQVLVD